MKKTSLIIIAAMLTLCFAGCSQNNASTTTAAPAATAAETTTAETTAATTTTAETTTKAEPVSVDPEQRLFKGYVESDKSEFLMSAPDESSDKLEELTYGTQFDVYPCDKDGWYIVVVGGEETGYIKSDIVRIAPHTLPFGDRLFGGYVASDEAVGLMSEPDESSEAAASIPGGTQLDIYDSDAPGWYMTSLYNEDTDSYIIGYIKSEYVQSVPGYDMDGYTPSLSDIAGRWIYEMQDGNVTDEYRGIPVGMFTIAEDGTYTYTSDPGSESSESGMIRITYEEYQDGSKVPWFSFYDMNGEFGFGCVAVAPAERTDGCLYIGQDGTGRLVPDSGNAVGGTDNASAPNEYGFYELKNPPAAGVSIAALSGQWYNVADPADQLYITSADDFYNGSFTYTNSEGTGSGYVKLEYLLNPDDTQTFWYTFYTNEGKLWHGFSVSGDIPLDDLYSDQDGAIHYTRVQNIDPSDITPNEYGFYEVKTPLGSGVSIAALEGTWVNAADPADKMTITAGSDIYSGTFTFTEAEGSGTGNIRIEFALNPDNTQTFWYNLYSADGKFINGFGVSGEIPLNDLYSGQDGAVHYTRAQG